jgi:hypothetical protein
MGRLIFRHEHLGQYIDHGIKDLRWPGIRSMDSVVGLLPLNGLAST